LIYASICESQAKLMLIALEAMVSQRNLKSFSRWWARTNLDK